MKLLSFIILIILFESCIQEKPDPFIPREFYYPDDSMGNGKTFTYYDSVNNRYRYADVKFIYSGNKKISLVGDYDSTLKKDSTLKFNGKIIEMYGQLVPKNGKLIKCEDLVDKTIDDHSRLGKDIFSCSWQDEVMSVKIHFEEIFVKDTSMLWHGKIIPP